MGPPTERSPGLSGPVDAVIDLVGGDTQRIAMYALKPGGVLISAVAAPDAALADSLGIAARFMLVDVNTEALTQIARQVDAGAIKASVGTVLPLGEAVSAHEMIEGRRPRAPGKIVLVMD